MLNDKKRWREFGQEFLRALKPKKRTRGNKLKLEVLFENFPDVDLTQSKFQPADTMLKEALLRCNKCETIAIVCVCVCV